MVGDATHAHANERPAVGRSPRGDSLRAMGAMRRYATLAHDRPWTCAGACVVACAAIVAACALDGMMAFTKPTPREWVLRDDEATTRADAGRRGARLAVSSRGVGVGASVERGKENVVGTFSFQWESEDVFTREHVRRMAEHERVVLARYESFCVLEDDGTCAPYLSPLSHFYVGDGDELVDDVEGVARDVFAKNASLYGYFLGKYDEETGVVGMTRAKYPVGTPLLATDDGTRSSMKIALDDDAQERVLLEEFLNPIERELFRRFSMTSSIVKSPYMSSAREGNLITRWDNELLRQQDSERVIKSDLAWTIASIGAVWVYMLLSTQSLFISSVGMLIILMSFPCALLIYRKVYGIPYLGNITGLSLFVVLGIGCDDIFVLWHSFTQTTDGSLRDRVAASFQRSSRAIFITSFTTTGAFLATAWSDLVPLAGFGVLSATMIVCLFICNVFMFPPAIVIYSRHVAKFEPYIRCVDPLCRKWRCLSRDESVDVDNGDDEKHALGPLERFFHGPFYSLLENGFVRGALLLGFALTFIVSLRYCLQLEVASKVEQWYHNKHMLQQFLNNQGAFPVSDADMVVPVDVIWGLKGVDNSGISKWDLESRGELVLDDRFDMSTPQAQAHVVKTCSILRNAVCHAPGCTDGKLVKSVSCFMEAFRDAIGADNFPVTADTFTDRLLHFLSSKDGMLYNDHVGVLRDEENADTAPKIFYAKITAMSTLQNQAPASLTRSLYEEFERTTQEINRMAPVGVETCFQTAYVAYTWMRMSETLVENTLQGISICFCMAFIVLCLSTGNLLIACICCTCVAGVLVTVLGLCVYRVMGWELGIRETIAAVILTGLAIDYAVHLVNAYGEAEDFSIYNRRDRTRYALSRMGVSIVASGVTTALSGSILWCCTLVFFSKFSTLLVTTILSSLLWSLIFISSLLLTIGPEGEDWKLKTIARWIVSRVRQSSESPY